VYFAIAAVEAPAAAAVVDVVVVVAVVVAGGEADPLLPPHAATATAVVRSNAPSAPRWRREDMAPQSRGCVMPL
jgi:hypothetical protein